MKPSFYLYLIAVVVFIAGQESHLFADRTAQILYFRAPKDAPKSAVIYQASEAPFEAELKRNNFSKSFKLSDGDIVLHFLGSKLVEGEEFPVGAPSVSVPAAYEKVLILAFTDPQNPVLPVRFKVINANQGSFGEGDRMFINFTDNKIAGAVGRKKLELGPFSVAVVKDAAGPKEEYSVSLDRLAPEQDKPVTFIRQNWRQSANQRSLIFIFSPPGGSGVTYYNAPIRNL
ncbi:MAG: hypothetical protein NWT02_12955 [Opitutales bacterium]|jgi:hypothetical protein|nr:hypothetical protein [Opitutales bacterium]MDP4644416.1 hypothetical protein [Opitutales bacterium]MDP4777882.1 hypothetical protein [Opitutales bacterium]MDP5079829.1 hypothetical protein [Opitutales bacterium]